MTDWVHAIVQIFVSGVWEEAICRVAGIHTWGDMMLKKLLLPREATLYQVYRDIQEAHQGRGVQS